MDLISRIKPSKEEIEFVEKITKDIFLKLKKIKFVNFVLGGSISKDTWLKGTKEVDIFAKFNYNKYKDKDISPVLYKELKKLFKIKTVHGSRDYFHISYKGFTFEIVPILDIKNPSDAQNVTDLSPLHISFVKKYPKLKDDIRLLKAFCKANSLYGAESYISGFSGYALEVLIIYYKSFFNVFKNASKWKEKVIIDVLKKVKDLTELNPSKIVSPLVIIDPVDKTRNISASLSYENFYKLITLCKEYLKKPSEKFFIFKTDIPKNSLIFNIKPLKGKSDVVNGKIVKAVNFILNELNRYGFNITNKGFIWGEEVKFWLKVKGKKLDLFEIKKGPPENLIDNAIEFKKKYKNIFVKKGIYYAKVKRKFTDINKLISILLKEKYVKERVKDISWKLN